MTEINPMVPATGCLETSRTRVRANGSGEEITWHYPVFGLRGDLTLVIEMHGRPATSADLDSLADPGRRPGSFLPRRLGRRRPVAVASGLRVPGHDLEAEACGSL